MKERILRLCKRLDKFTFEEVLEITEDIEEQDLKNIFDNLYLKQYLTIEWIDLELIIS